MEVTLNILDEVYDVIEKVAELEKKSVEVLIGEGIRVYLQGSLDSNLREFFDFDPENQPILE